MKKIILFVLFLLMLFILALVLNSGPIDFSKGKSEFEFAANKQAPRFQSLPDVSLSIIKTGEANTLEALVYSGGRVFKKHTISHAAILIKHPEANILFDAGLGTQIDQQFAEGMPFWVKPLLAYKNKNAVRTQLRSNNIDPETINIILASHLHWDHASGIEDFPRAEIWLLQAEHEWAKQVASKEPGVILSQFDDENIKWRYIQFDDVPYENFTQSLDVFRDGSIVMVPLAGHTPGAFGLFVNLKSGKRFLFTGDTTWAIEGFQSPANKHWLPAYLVDVDKEQTQAAIIQIHQLMQKYPELIVVPAHDNKAHEIIGLFPKFIR